MSSIQKIVYVKNMDMHGTVYLCMLINMYYRVLKYQSSCRIKARFGFYCSSKFIVRAMVWVWPYSYSLG